MRVSQGGTYPEQVQVRTEAGLASSRCTGHTKLLSLGITTELPFTFIHLHLPSNDKNNNVRLNEGLYSSAPYRIEAFFPVHFHDVAQRTTLATGGTE